MWRRISKALYNCDKISSKTEALHGVTFLRRKCTKNLFLRHSNVNSVRKKFEALEFLYKDKFDVLLVNESKLNLRFPEAQFRSWD